MMEKKRKSGKISMRNILIGLLVGVIMFGAGYVVVDRQHLTDILAGSALAREDFKQAEIWLRLGGHPDRFNLNRLLEAAVSKNASRQVENYLQAGADPNYLGAGNLPMVYLAARAGFDDIVARLAASGADMDFHPRQRRNPLLWIASKANDKQAFQLLLEHGSDPNVITDYGYPIAFICYRKKQYDWFDLLVEHGADLSYVSPSRRTLLDYALLAKHKPSIDLLSSKGVPVLRTSAPGTRLIEMVKHDAAPAVKERLRAGDNPYIPNKYEANALETAIFSEAVLSARTLLEAGVDPNIPFGKPLREAVDSSNQTLVRMLLEKGAKPDAREERGYRTALHDAACKSLPMVKMLVAHGADINATCRFQERTPLWFAINCGNAEIAAFLESKGAHYSVDDGWYSSATDFEKAAVEGDITALKQMVNQGQDINERDAFGDTALHFAAAAGQLDAMRWLIKHGGLPMFRGFERKTPLFWAAQHGQLEACRFLLNNGCRVTDKTNYGENPLHAAARGNQAEVVKFLLKRGADVNANGRRATPLMIAARRNAGEAARALIEGGADINNQGSFGRTAMHSAVSYDSPQVVQVLLDHHADIHTQDNRDVTPIELAKTERDSLLGSKAYRLIMKAAGTPFDPSFDCGRAASSIEQLICADRELSNLDVELNHYFQLLVTSLEPDKAKPFREQQREWLTEGRESCVFSKLHYPEDNAFYKAVKCLRPVYQERIQEVRRLTNRYRFTGKEGGTTEAEAGAMAGTDTARVKTWGDYAGKRNQAGQNRFHAFYYNTNDPMHPIADEMVDRIGVNYFFKEFHGIHADHFGAYWAGNFEFSTPRRMLFQVTSTPARMKILVDGAVVFTTDKVHKAEIQHWFPQGNHLVEIEYVNKWHIADLLVRFAEEEPEYSESDVRLLLTEAMTDKPHLWYAAAHGSDQADHAVRVTTTATDRPVVLMLRSSRAVRWEIPNTEQNRILAVFYASNDPGSSVLVPAGSSVKVYHVKPKVIPYVGNLPMGWWEGVENLSDSMFFTIDPRRFDGYTGSDGRTNAILVPMMSKDIDNKAD
ncbi:ankyrin repeat domain-containing protein [Desulfobulbus rhabdoformis]|uniref:ankyrin repeat domain-containing protein n=1 Tax=Desulfobulbus rhabdoformis TaxID=34032 RepID=UPI001962A8D9|nr:ankyrin repeat domain-containing protein [Desulfobulbus rhabdoformis]MBM9614670.1 ankyrin repeat domain-containing protein [Desulfobulbus rhabdoformis]